MPLLIDAYNVLHHPEALPPELAAELDVMSVIKLLHGSRYGRRRATLVCDGGEKPDAPAGSSGLVEVVYSGAGRTADEVIIELVERSTTPRRLLVVTSDREIVRAVRKRRCQTSSSPVFLKRLAADHGERRGRLARPPKPARPRGPLSPDEVERWTAQFDLDVEQVAGEVELPDHLLRPAAGERGEPAAKTPRAARPPEPLLPPDVIREAEELLRDGPDD